MGEQVDRAKGKAKEAVGDLTDDERLKREGKLDKAGADIKEKADETVDRVREGIQDALRRDPD